MAPSGPPLPATKVVCTLGPASIGRVDELVGAGMSVARLNLAHGTADGHADAVRAVRAAAARAGREIAILADLPGPKIRLGALADGAVDLAAGARFELRAGRSAGDATGVTTSHADLASDLEVGDRVLLADGAVELVVVEDGRDRVVTRVERGGTVRSGAGVGVPSERLSSPALTDTDLALLPLILELRIDLIGQSFVRSADDIDELRRSIGLGGPAIVAKIETRPAVEHAADIAARSDALMVARGDLGVELPFEDVPHVQKRLVRLANEARRPVIVATQMLESMTLAPRPTRAEASDVANAVLDGADAVMLSGETAIGQHPILAVDAAIRICRAAEAADRGTSPIPMHIADRPANGAIAAPVDGNAVALAAVALAAADPGVDVVACFTRSGRTARLLAGLRPTVPILAITPDAAVARALAIHRGVHTMVAADPDGAAAIGSLLRDAIRRTAGMALGHPARAAVLVASTAGGGSGPNLVEVVRVD